MLLAVDNGTRRAITMVGRVITCNYVISREDANKALRQEYTTKAEIRQK